MVLSKPERLAFAELCNDSRQSSSELARKLGITRYNANKILKNLESKYHIKYTMDLDYRALGFAQMHVFYLNFDTTPKLSELEKLLKNSTRIVFFATAKGDFDAIALAISRNSMEYSQIEVGFQASLIDYKTTFRSAALTGMRFGFMPLSNVQLRNAAIEEDYKKLLLELNADSRIPAKELASKLGIDDNMINYYIKKMQQNGIIKRFTAMVTDRVFPSTIVAFINYQVSNGIGARIERERHELYFSEDDEIEDFNHLNEMWSISGAAQAFIMASFSDLPSAEGFIKKHKEIYKPDNPSVKYAEIKDVIIGSIPFRKMNVRKEYDQTAWPTEIL
ncbi:MAG: winged helix-turn-helix transcriptional regulator [Candidatus Micrarchaeaceae archaeon]